MRLCLLFSYFTVSYTYYHNYRDKDKKVKRKKLFVRDKDSPKNFKDAILQISYKEKTQKIDNVKITLQSLSEEYFKERYTIVKDNFILNFADNISIRVEDDSIYKSKVSAVKQEVNRFKNHISSHYMSTKQISDIELNDIKEFKNYLVAKNLSTKTKHLIYSLAKTIWNNALDNNSIKYPN